MAERTRRRLGQPRVGREAARRGRRRIPAAARRGVGPLIVVWAGWLILMTGANVAAPLYALFAERFGFSTLVLTLVFAAYAFALVPALIVFGRVSDRFGRRPVIVAGLAVACAGLILFAAAQGTAWLFV